MKSFLINHPQTLLLLSRRGPISQEVRLSQHYIGPKRHSDFFQISAEYMFLSAGKFMPGMEKLAGELFFPTKGQLFLRPQGVKTVLFREKKSSSASFFLPGINFSAYRIHFPVWTLLDLTSDKLLVPPLQILHNLLADRPRPPAGVGGSRGGEAPLGWTMTTLLKK